MVVHNDTTELPAREMTLLTISDVEALRAQNIGRSTVWFVGAPDTTPPANVSGGIKREPGEAITASDSLADLFPGVPNVARVFGYSESAGLVSVSHV